MSTLTVTGPAAARRLLDEVAADPLTPLRLAVVAPGGYGKTAVLDELADRYRLAGLRVSRDPAVPADVLLVDDAHRLGDDALDRMRVLAGDATVGIGVAYRPATHRRALGDLAAALSHGRPPLVLVPLDLDQISDLLDEAGLGYEPDLARWVHAQTGGVPRFAHRLVQALRETGAPDEVPWAAVAQFQPELSTLDNDVEVFLLAAEAGAGLDAGLLAGALRRAPEEVLDVAEAARATGLLGPDGELLPIARRAVAALLPVQRRTEVRRRLAEAQLARGGPVLGLARSLLETGIGGPGPAAAFEAAAVEALPVEPALSARLFAAGVAAGRPLPELAARWARAAALAGDLDSALLLADRVLDTSRPDRDDAAAVAAAALAQRGQLAHSADLYLWSGGGPLATVTALGTGHLPAAPDLPTVDSPPTMLGNACALMARGVHDSVAGTPISALTHLVRATDLLLPAGAAVLLPDSPAALAALVALHSGELAVAESALARAAGAGLGGVLFTARHHLLLAWSLMVGGRTAAARHALAAARDARRALDARDQLFALALDTALARRDSDLAAMRRGWTEAGATLMRHPVDLFMLLPLGELTVAAARVGESGRLAPHLAEADALLHRLGDPPLWTAPLRWSRLHAAIIAEQPAVAAEHAAELAALAERAGQERFPAALAAAARCWLDVLAGKVDPGSAEAAARELHAAGLCWDGARLAAQAAINTKDRKAMVVLLDCARGLQGRPAGAPAHRVDTAPSADQVRLSGRERQVASLVVAGLTYKQIGDRLFISPKTVEHHVARIRQRLDCTSRGDLLARLRELVGPQPVPL